MIVNGHGCSSKGFMGCWPRNYLFTWTTGGLSGPPRNCGGKPLEGGVHSVPGWTFRTPQERSNLHHRRRSHGLLLLPIPGEV